MSSRSLLRSFSRSIPSTQSCRASLSVRSSISSISQSQSRNMSSTSLRFSNCNATSLISPPAPLRIVPPTASEEAQDFKKACEEVQAWFDSPRFKGIKRPYGPDSVVSKRGSLPVQPPTSSLMADKLFNILTEKAKRENLFILWGLSIQFNNLKWLIIKKPFMFLVGLLVAF